MYVPLYLRTFVLPEFLHFKHLNKKTTSTTTTTLDLILRIIVDQSHVDIPTTTTRFILHLASGYSNVSRGRNICRFGAMTKTLQNRTGFPNSLSF